MTTVKVQLTKSTKTANVSTSNRADCLRYGRSVGAVTHSHDQPLSYRALQRACKAAGVSAKGSTATLRKRLWEAEFGHLEPNPVPLTRRQRAQAQQSTVPEPAPSPAPKPRKSPKEPAKRRLSTLGVGYRESQRFCSLWRTEDKFVLPCKNAGWDNIEENIQAIMDDPRFWGWAATDHGAKALATLGVTL